MAAAKKPAARQKMPMLPMQPSKGPPPGATALPPYIPPVVSRSVTPKAAGTNTRKKTGGKK